MAALVQQPYGIALPIQRGPTGYFNPSFDIVEQTKYNLMTFLRTRKGDRRMMPTYGSGLYQELFEANGAELQPIIEDVVKQDIATWMPELNIVSVTVNTDVDNYKVAISVSFTMSSIGITQPQTVTVVMNQPAI